MITITTPIPGGTRTETFDEHGEPIGRVDDFGPHRGQTVYGPQWVTDEARREAVARLAAVDELRRRKVMA